MARSLKAVRKVGGRKEERREKVRKGGRKEGREEGRAGLGASLRELLGRKPQAHLQQVLKPKASASASTLFSKVLSFAVLATGDHVRM